MSPICRYLLKILMTFEVLDFIMFFVVLCIGVELAGEGLWIQLFVFVTGKT